jgi:hypothetical protein
LTATVAGASGASVDGLRNRIARPDFRAFLVAQPENGRGATPAAMPAPNTRPREAHPAIRHACARTGLTLADACARHRDPRWNRR